LATKATAEIAAEQFGRIARVQLLGCGFSSTSIERLLSRGWLHPILPGVYAVGHIGGGRAEGLASALLYAGPPAALRGRTGLHWLGLIPTAPASIEIATRSRSRSRPGIQISHPRELARIMHQGLPVTPVTEALLEAAPELPFDRLRRALSEAIYQRMTTLEKVEAVLGRGRPGSKPLRRAVENHRPELALTRSELEIAFVSLCERGRIPMPEINGFAAGHMVDALWADRRIVVELDGHRTHAEPVAIETDRQREMDLRREGYTVVRYTWWQIIHRPEEVLADLRRVLGL